MRSIVIGVSLVVLCAACASVDAAPRPIHRATSPTSSTLAVSGLSTSDRSAGDQSAGDRSAGDRSAGSASATRDASTPTTAPSASTSTTTATTTTATSTSTTTSSTTTSTTMPPPRHVTMAFTGDTLTHSPLWRGAQRLAAEAGREGFHFVPMLARLRPLIEPVDLAVCHLETPIAPLGEELSTAPRYGVPEEIVDAIAQAGYDRCSTASNHALDRGSIGVVRTIEVLESRGLGQSGMARTPEEILPTVFDVGGVTVSHLSYTFSYNGLLPPSGEEWRSAIIDPDRIVADARRAREVGAEIVVVSLHWGAERIHTPTQDQRELADQLTASGLVDLIVGHHAHVVQPIEHVNGKWVLFGLGNILSNLPTSSNWPAASQDAMVVTVDIAVTADGAATVGRPVVHPTWVDKNANWIVRPVAIELADPDLPPGLREQLDRSLARTAAIVGEFIAAS